jgi:hypothetical protein
MLRRAARSIRKREAVPFARQDELRSVRLARRLSRPSMGRDTLCLPSNSVASGRMGRGSERRRIGSLRAEAPGPPTTPSSAARWRARGGRRSHGARGSTAVQAGLQMHVSRRAEPLPSLPQAITPPGTSGAKRLTNSAAGRQPAGRQPAGRQRRRQTAPQADRAAGSQRRRQKNSSAETTRAPEDAQRQQEGPAQRLKPACS